MIENNYRRLFGKVRGAVVKGFGYYILLDNHWLWTRLRKRHREMAARMGAASGNCPEFREIKDLAEWLGWLLRQDDLDEELRSMLEGE